MGVSSYKLLVSCPTLVRWKKDCHGNPISTFPPCCAFQMIFTANAPRLIQSISCNVYNKNRALKQSWNLFRIYLIYLFIFWGEWTIFWGGISKKNSGFIYFFQHYKKKIRKGTFFLLLFSVWRSKKMEVVQQLLFLGGLIWFLLQSTKKNWGGN